MKILYSGTLDINAGGPATSVYNTLWGLSKQNVDVRLVMYPPSSDGCLAGKKVPVCYTPSPPEHKFAYSCRYKEDVRALGEFDIYHAQGIWQYPTYALIDVARSERKPYLVTPRGMLYPQDIAKSNKWLKKLSLKIRLLKDLNQAACVHVTCREEMEHCRRLGVTSPIAIIPNPIEIKDYIEKKKDDKFRLGYLGRLSPRKNVESLIYAFAALKDIPSDAELLIVGGGDRKYKEFLKREVAHLNLHNVCFSEFVSGAEKDKTFASLSVLALPSEFENFGMVIAEALVRRIPCIATKGAPWQDLEIYGCGWWTEYNQDAITNVVQKAMLTPTEMLKIMGERGKELVCNHYSIETVTDKMKILYEWILGIEDKPDFVYE